METPYGKILKDIRIYKGLTLEDVSKKLYLKVSILKSLEEGTYDMSSPAKLAALKRFIISYAKFLKTNPHRILQIIEDERAKKENLAKKISKSISEQKESTEKQHLNPYLLKTLVLAFLAFGLAVLFLISITIKEYQRERAPSSYSGLSPLNHARLDLKENTSFKVKIDNEPEFLEVYGKAHTTFSYTFKSHIDLELTNAGVVSVFFNQLSLGTLGVYGKPYFLRLPLEEKRRSLASPSQVSPEKKKEKNDKL